MTDERPDKSDAAKTPNSDAAEGGVPSDEGAAEGGRDRIEGSGELPSPDADRVDESQEPPDISELLSRNVEDMSQEDMLRALEELESYSAAFSESGDTPSSGSDAFLGMHSMPVPEDLHSAYDGGPFKTCTVCSRQLSECELYEIQKVMRGEECIFELAVCQDCGESLVQEFSKESVETMKGFLLSHFKPTPEPHHCHFCGFPRASFKNFTVLGACRTEVFSTADGVEREPRLLMPRIVMCEKCSETLQEGLSQKTKDIQGDFIRDHFPGVPAGLDLSPSFTCF